MSKENKYEDIQIIDIEDYEDVYDLIENSRSRLNKETDYIAVYGKRELIAYLFTEMMKEDYQFGYADFDVLDETLSDSIYLMIVRKDCTISVEPAISKSEKVIGHDAKIALIDIDECKQNVIDYCVNSDKKVVLFGKADAKETSVSKDNAVYKVNRENVSRETYLKAVADFDEQFKDILHDGLIQYCRIMDGFNDLLSAFRW